MNSDLSELALNKLVASDEEEVALSLPVTEETAWEAYRKMKADGAAVQGRPTPTVGVAPTPGGAMAFTTVAF